MKFFLMRCDFLNIARDDVFFFFSEIKKKKKKRRQNEQNAKERKGKHTHQRILDFRFIIDYNKI